MALYVFWSVVLGAGNAALAFGASVPDFAFSPCGQEDGCDPSILQMLWAVVRIPEAAAAPMLEAFYAAWDWPRTVAVFIGEIRGGNWARAAADLNAVGPLTVALDGRQWWLGSKALLRPASLCWSRGWPPPVPAALRVRSA
jgi:hypothetical protein